MDAINLSEWTPLKLYTFSYSVNHVAYAWWNKCPDNTVDLDQFLKYVSRYLFVTFMPLPFEEWWKGLIVLPLCLPVSVRVRDGVSILLRLSLLGVSNLSLSFSGGGISVLWTDFWSYCFFLILKMPRKTTSENVICFCRLRHPLANFSNILFAYRQIVWTQIRLLLEEQSDLGPYCLQQ